MRIKKKTKQQLILATPAGIAAVIAVGATVHAHGQLKATREIQRQLINQQGVELEVGAHGQ